MAQDPDSTPDALVEAGLALHQAGDLARAEALYRAALAQAPDHLNALQLLGVLAFSAGRPAEAAERLAAAIEVLGGRETAQHAAIYCNLGNALLALGRPADAISRYLRGIELAPEASEIHANLGNALMGQGERIGAAHSYAAAIRLEPGQWDKVAALARALVADGEAAEAVLLLELLASLRPTDPAIRRELGRALYAAGRIGEAVACFGRVLELAPGDADAEYSIARIRHQQRDLTAAEAGYRRALAAAPQMASALYNLAVIYLQELDQPETAIVLLERLLAGEPGHFDAHMALADAHERLHEADPAIASYQRALALRPDSFAGHYRLGRLLVEDGRSEAAVAALLKAAALDPSDPRPHVELGNVLQRLDRSAEARPHYRRALELEPLIRRPAEGAPAFKVLAIFAPGAANTPSEYLLGRCRYDVNFLLLLPDADPDLALLRANGDLVVNLISDADQGEAMLPLAAALVDRLGRPVINHPDRIRPTGREAIARLLEGVPGCVVPRTRRLDAAALRAPGFLEGPDAPALPFLLRLAGTHGGDDFERIDEAGQIEPFVAAHETARFYAIDYADYRSADGFFRKYRFFFVGEAILPYHLAIGRDWKVHHFRTDMADHAWMKQEEHDFLDRPWSVFGPAARAALEAIRDRVGLDFFGIDCALDRAGRLVMFETNASMLVQPFTPHYPYKPPYIARIKEAWDALLARRAAEGR